MVSIGGPVHYADFGGPPGGPALVLVHGLAGSHLNWCLLAPMLAARTRVVAIDLVGFGLSEPQGRSASMPANTELLDRFIWGVVVGHGFVLSGGGLGLSHRRDGWTGHPESEVPAAIDLVPSRSTVSPAGRAACPSGYPRGPRTSV